ncbi:cysteine proteinase B-like isoform X1 [Pieris napi]|uniref:cysteine proteinase B-like isoform X1 n=1 Tax=Pieris napi TaxID=78633 RepID=UPI001FBAB373|nr:cysteine proteinase B-like isoform X1 [Pieris napi]
MRFRELIVVYLFHYVHCFSRNSSYLKPIHFFPDYVDWRERNGVTAVKDQKSCGACWAFSAVANIESHIKIYLGTEIILSEQFLIDCDVERTGCSSTTVLKTFAEIVSTFGGVLKEKDYYPYSDRPEECRWNRENPKPIPVIGFQRVSSDEAVMAEYLSKCGPLSAAINSASMYNYKPKDGLIPIDEPTEDDCSSKPEDLNHAVLIVGYSAYEYNGRITPYWIIKNSWGSEWGDRGYYYLVRGRNACGISKDVSFSFVNQRSCVI